MRFAKAVVAVTVLSLALSSQAKAAFVAPTSLAPYMPANNVATVIKVSTVGNLDVYKVVQTGAPFAVVKGTALAAVVKQASLSLAFNKLLINTGLAGSTNFADRQAATLWFYANVAPLY